MLAENHELRRRWIANTTASLISREGLEAVTFRRVAAELGFSTTSVTHYFADKTDLLLETFRSFKHEGFRGFRERYERTPDDLLGHLASIVSPENRDIGRCFCALRAKALHDDRFADEYQAYSARCEAYIRMFAQNTTACGKDPERAARMFISVVQGISSQLAMNVGSWSRETIHSEFTEIIEMVSQGRH